MKRPGFHTIIIILFFATAGTNMVQASNVGDTLMWFNAGILTPTPDRVLFGIEYAEGHLWMTGADPDDLWQQKLYKFTADGETLVETYEYGLEFVGWGGLAYDGAYLWTAGVDSVWQIDIETGQKTGYSFAAPLYYNKGIAYDPDSDHFWIAGENSVIYEVDKLGTIHNAVSFIPDQGLSGLAWDNVSEGGPYLWIWAMKYTPSDVRPVAYQMNVATGTITDVTFEGVTMNPLGPYAPDGAAGATITDQVVDGKLTFIGVHTSDYETWNDQMDWVVAYDLDPEGTGVPGPEISIMPESIQNEVMPGDTVDVPVYISNLDSTSNLNWFANLEYPGMWDTVGTLGDTLLTFDVTALTAPDTNRRARGIAQLGDYIYVSTARNFDNQFMLYKIKNDGSEIVQTFTFYSAFIGWTAITSDEEFIYGADQYTIQQYDPVSGGIVSNYLKNSFSADALAYDPQQEHFFMGNSVGAIKEIDKNGDEINFFVTSYEIEGLSWDAYSPGGPYLWAYHTGQEGEILATRLNPNTAAPTGSAFEGVNLSINNNYPDTPKDIIVSRDWRDNSLVLIALHDSETNAGAGADQVVVYDLATTPPPGWIELLSPAFGVTEPLDTDTAFVRLMAIMEDTLMEAQIVINSNDVLNPNVIIPVNFRMMPEVTVGLDADNGSKTGLARNIYPNPTTSFMEINLNETKAATSIEMYNNTGTLVKSMQIQQGFHNARMDVSELPAGIYLMIIRSGNKSDNRKVIIQ